MSTLTRLRRVLRDGYDAHRELQVLLDTLDTIHEMQADMEEELAEGHYPTEEEVFHHIQQSVGLLMNTMVLKMPSLGSECLLAMLIEERGHQTIASELAQWKKSYDDRLNADDVLGGLDDHPF